MHAPLAPQLSPRTLSAPLQEHLAKALVKRKSLLRTDGPSTPRMDAQSCANCTVCRKRPGKACRKAGAWSNVLRATEAMQHVQGCSSQLSSRRSALNLTTADRTFKRGYTLVAHTGAEAISLSCINIYSNVSEGDSANWDSTVINLLYCTPSNALIMTLGRAFMDSMVFLSAFLLSQHPTPASRKLATNSVLAVVELYLRLACEVKTALRPERE